MKLHVKLSSTRCPVFRAGYSLCFLICVCILSFLILNFLQSIQMKIFFVFSLLVATIVVFDKAVSEIIVSSRRVMVVTPFRYQSFCRQSISDISVVQMPGSYFFMILFKTEQNRINIYYFVGPYSNLGAYAKTTALIMEALKWSRDGLGAH